MLRPSHQLQPGGLGWVLHAGDAVKHVEQQRLQKVRIGSHLLEIKDLQSFDGQRIDHVVEQPA